MLTFDPSSAVGSHGLGFLVGRLKSLNDIPMKTKLTFAACSLLACASSYGVVLFDASTDPLQNSGFAIATATAGANGIPDASRGDVLELTYNSGTPGFYNINSGVIDLPAGDETGLSYTASFDLFIPAATTVDSGNNIFIQFNIDGANSGSNGFVSAPNGDWQTFSVTGMFTGDATSVQALVVNNDQAPAGGTTSPAFYVDNFFIDVEAVPEPSSALLLGLGALGLLRRRR